MKKHLKYKKSIDDKVRSVPHIPETKEQLFIRNIVTQVAKQYMVEFDDKENPAIQSVGFRWRKGKDGNPEAVLGFFIRPGKDLDKHLPTIPEKIYLSDLQVYKDDPGNVFQIDSVVTRLYPIAKIKRLAGNPADPTEAQPAPPIIIQPGAIVIGHPNSLGTIGLLFRRKSEANPNNYMSGIFILSAAHVLAGDSYSTDNSDAESAVMQPVFPGNAENMVVGRLRKVNEGADFAYALIANNLGREIDSQIKGIGKPLAPVANIQTGDLLMKSGRTTGVTRGMVDFTEVIQRADDNSVVFDHHAFTINSNVNGANPQAVPIQPFAENGDSGAVVVRVIEHANGTREYAPTGMLLEKHIFSNGTVRYVAIKLTDVLTKNNLRGEMYVKPEPPAD